MIQSVPNSAAAFYATVHPFPLYSGTSTLISVPWWLSILWPRAFSHALLSPREPLNHIICLLNFDSTSWLKCYFLRTFLWPWKPGQTPHCLLSWSSSQFLPLCDSIESKSMLEGTSWSKLVTKVLDIQETTIESHSHTWAWMNDVEKECYQKPRAEDAWWTLEFWSSNHIVGDGATAKDVQRRLVRKEKYLGAFLLLPSILTVMLSVGWTTQKARRQRKWSRSVKSRK